MNSYTGSIATQECVARHTRKIRTPSQNQETYNFRWRTYSQPQFFISHFLGQNALITLLREGLLVQESSVDSKRDLEDCLRSACNDFIEHTSSSLLGPTPYLSISARIPLDRPQARRRTPWQRRRSWMAPL